jgi:Seryl-tRNA synthetase
MVKVTDQESSFDELESMTANAENILKKLNLPYHVIVLSSGDAVSVQLRHMILKFGYLHKTSIVKFQVVQTV